MRREDAFCRSKWSVDVNQITAGLRLIWPPLLIGDTIIIMIIIMVIFKCYFYGELIALSLKKYITKYNNKNTTTKTTITM